MTKGLVDPEFVRLGEALQVRRRFRGRLRRTAVTVACAVPSVHARVPALARLPRLQVPLSRTPAGERMAAKYGGRRHGVPRSLAVSVLEVPAEQATYLRGRSRQALRTNSRRAREAGVGCRRLDGAEAETRLAALLTARGEEDLIGGVRDDLASGLVTAWLAEDADGVTEAAALTTRDGAFGRLDLMVSAPDRETSPARYLLSAHLIGELGAAGVRHLAVDSALFLHPGLRHFQQLLGFEPTTLALAVPSARRPEPSPRRAPALRGRWAPVRPSAI